VRALTRLFRALGALEGWIARFFERPFARGPIHPLEFRGRLLGALGNYAVQDDGALCAPNLYEIRLHPTDYQQLSGLLGILQGQLQRDIAEHARARGYELLSDPIVRIERDQRAPRGMPRIFALPVDRRAIAEDPALLVGSAARRLDGISAGRHGGRDGVPPDPKGPRLEALDVAVPPRVFPVCNGATLIGRHSSSDIQIDDERVSRFHATISKKGDRYLLSDLDSLVGTCRNGTAITIPAWLQSGDRIAIGGHAFVFFDGS
jgi:hypothetical protein